MTEPQRNASGEPASDLIGCAVVAMAGFVVFLLFVVSIAVALGVLGYILSVLT